MIKFYGILNDRKTIITDNNTISRLCEKNIGEKHKNFLVLDEYETMYLLDNNWLELKSDKKKINAKKYLETLILEKKEFLQKYQVYFEFKNLGYIIKTGLKFGFDFRVYPKGKKIDNAHTKYVVSVISENKKITTKDLAKSIRLSIGLNTEILIAIVDNEFDVTYYKFSREKIK